MKRPRDISNRIPSDTPQEDPPAMKRRCYRIYVNSFLAETRYSWNAARRAVAGLIRARLDDNGRAEQIETKYTKNAAGDYCQGLEKWQDNQGNQYLIEITREDG